MSQMLVIQHRFKKIGLHNLVVRRIVSDILQVLGLKKVEKHCFIGFEVLIVVIIKSVIFWDITPCSPLKVNRIFGVTYRRHLQCRKNNPSKIPACGKQNAEDSTLQMMFRCLFYDAVNMSDCTVSNDRMTDES
jgi:hypothetical protein